MRKNRPVIELPRIIDIKFNAIESINDILNRLNLNGKTLVVADKITFDIAGKRVFDHISGNSKLETNHIIVDKATVKEAERVESIIKNEKINFVIAVGGGSVIDISKYSSYQSKIPFISVPTVASHDGIASARASLFGTTKKHSFEAHSPIAVIGDVETISKAPKRFRISGSSDLLSNLTAVMDWKLSHRITGEHISQYAVALSEITANTIIDRCEIIVKNDIEGTYIVLKGLITSSMAMCIASSSRPASGAEHMISHMLDEKTKTTALHGEQCGIASLISMYLHGGDYKLIKKTLNILGAPTNLADINLTREELIDAILTAQSIRKDRFSILSGGISRSAAEKAIKITGIK